MAESERISIVSGSRPRSTPASRLRAAAGYDYLASLQSTPDEIRARIEIMPSGCWAWLGCRYPEGYGRLKLRQIDVLAHRLSYITFRGSFDPLLDLDHLCRNRMCVNPEHLEPVSMLENVRRGMSPPAINARKTQCANGHALAGANVRYERLPSGTLARRCHACAIEKQRVRRANARAEADAA